MQTKTWTVKEILTWTQDYFRDKEIDSPRTTSELLLGKALDLSRVNLYVNFDRPLTEKELKLYKSYIKRRVAGEPAQYITGFQEFWSLDFKVSPAVLIPRADTETLVEAVTDYIKFSGRGDVKILDIGAGSGAISVSIAHELKGKAAVNIKAVDISEDALSIAEENAKINDVSESIEFILSDKFSSIAEDERFDYIVSNPPYIAKEYYDALENKVKDYEPKIALYGGEDGLTFYRDILEKGHAHLKDNGKILFEIDFRKANELENIIDSDMYSDIKYHMDLSGRKRVLEITKKG